MHVFGRKLQKNIVFSAYPLPEAGAEYCVPCCKPTCRFRVQNDANIAFLLTPAGRGICKRAFGMLPVLHKNSFRGHGRWLFILFLCFSGLFFSCLCPILGGMATHHWRHSAPSPTSSRPIAIAFPSRCWSLCDGLPACWRGFFSRINVNISLSGYRSNK